MMNFFAHLNCVLLSGNSDICTAGCLDCLKESTRFGGIQQKIFHKAAFQLDNMIFNMWQK